MYVKKGGKMSVRNIMLRKREIEKGRGWKEGSFERYMVSRN